MSKSYEHTEIENCFIERETAAAILVNNGVTSFWIPKSQIHDDSEVYKSDTSGTLIIPEWLAIEKELV